MNYKWVKNNYFKDILIRKDGLVCAAVERKIYDELWNADILTFYGQFPLYLGKFDSKENAKLAIEKYFKLGSI